MCTRRVQSHTIIFTGHIQTTFKDGVVKTILSPRGVVSQAPAASDDRTSRSPPYKTQLPLAARAGSPNLGPRLPHTKAAAAHNRKLADLALPAAKMAGEGYSATPTPENAPPQRIPYLPASTLGPVPHHGADDPEMRSRAADDAPQISNSPLPSPGEESRPPASVPTPDVVTRIGDMGNGEGVHVPTTPQKSKAGVPRPSAAPRRSLSPPEGEASVQIPAFQVSAGVTAPSSTSVPPPALPQPERGESNADVVLPTFAGASLSSKQTGATGATWPPRQFQGELQDADASTESDKSKTRPGGGTAPESGGRTYNKSPLPTVLATSSPKPMAERMRIRHQRHASAPDEVPADLDVKKGRSSFRDQFKSESDFLPPLTQESDGDLASHSSEIGHFRKSETVDRTSTSGAIMRARIKELEEKLKSVTEAYDMRISDLIAEREAVERACVLNATTASWLESEHESLQAQLSRLEMTSSKKIFTLESTLEKISSQVQPALEALESKCNEMQRALASKDEAILAKNSEFFAEIAVKNESISSLEKLLELELEKVRTQCAAEIASKNVSISDLERHRTENEAMIKQQESKLKQQEKLAAKVVTLEEENARLSDEMSATRKVIQESSAKYDFKVTSLEEQLAEVKKAKIELEDHDGALRSKLAQKQTQITELLKENAHMRADLQEAEANEQSEMQKMRDEIRQLEQVKEEHCSLQMEHEDLQRQTSQLREIHDRMQKENAGLQESLNRALMSGQVSSAGSQIPRLPPAFFAQNYTETRTPLTPEREAKFVSAMHDIRGVNSYLIEQCRELVTRIKSSMFDDSNGKVERGCTGSFQQLDMVLSQLGVSLNKMEEAISPDKSHSASLAAAAESQVVRARVLADTLQARLNALDESERQRSKETDSERRMQPQAGSDFDVPGEHREADRMHQVRPRFHVVAMARNCAPIPISPRLIAVVLFANLFAAGNPCAGQRHRRAS